MTDLAPALDAPPPPPPRRDGGFTRRPTGVIGLGVLALVFGVCLATLPYTVGRGEDGAPRYNAQNRLARHLPPSWASPSPDGVAGLEHAPDSPAKRLHDAARAAAMQRLATQRDTTPEALAADGVRPSDAELRAAAPRFFLGTDILGRSLLIRCLTGGGISLGIGLAAAAISIVVGTLYGTVAAYAGGRIDAVMMRAVDVLYGLPYVLLVVLLAVAIDAKLDDYQAALAKAAPERRAAYVERSLAALPPTARGDAAAAARLSREAGERYPGEIDAGTLQAIRLGTLLVAIGGVSWLTMARVIRGQVLSLKAQPFVEAARAIGASPVRIFRRHLLPNLVGPIVVYATLTVPQAILQESFLSFLGIGVRPPLPSWGNLAAEGLTELNPYRTNWWLLFFPCVLLGLTLLALNFVGEGLREAMDPRRSRR